MEAAAASAARPGVAELWAENTRDETMRAELESLLERASEVGRCRLTCVETSDVPPGFGA